jgi:hypothetical protein
MNIEKHEDGILIETIILPFSNYKKSEWISAQKGETEFLYIKIDEDEHISVDFDFDDNTFLIQTKHKKKRYVMDDKMMFLLLQKIIDCYPQDYVEPIEKIGPTKVYPKQEKERCLLQ